jgi:hypothetical protein
MAKQTTEVKENVKKGRAHYSHDKLDKRWAKLREEAEDRQDDYNKLTTAQKLDKALKRVAAGVGECKREIARLQKRAKAEKEAKKVLPQAKTVVK